MKTLSEHLASQDLAMAEARQRTRHAFRAGPQCIRKWIARKMWRPGFRHMRYVVPEVALQPLDGGAWKFTTREKGGRSWMSRPLDELRRCIGKPAALIATGPSAKAFDWSTLKEGNHSIWAVNGAPTLLAEHAVACDFLVVTDHRFAREGIAHIRLAAEQGARLVFTLEAAAGVAATEPEILERSRFYVCEKVNGWYAIPQVEASLLAAMNEASGNPFLLPGHGRAGVGWSHDPLQGIFAGRTVAFAALQLMVWAGARETEVVGLDLGGRARAYDELVPAVSHLENDKRDFILPSFECMSLALAGSGIRITNHSQVSPLPRDLVPLHRVS